MGLLTSWRLGSHGYCSTRQTAEAARLFQDLETGAGIYPESLIDHETHLPTPGSVSRRSFQARVGSPPKSRCQPCLGSCLGLRAQTRCHVHLCVSRTHLLVVLGLRSPFPCWLSAESHAQLSKVTHTPGHLAHPSPMPSTMRQVPLQLSVPAFPPRCQLEKTP